MSSFYYLDENKNAIPCDCLTWGYQLKSMKDNKHVGDEEINGKRISTVWLGLNHQRDDCEPPLIFETMVFGEDGYMRDIYCERYSTWQEAEEGHKRAVEWVKNGCKDE